MKDEIKEILNKLKDSTTNQIIDVPVIGGVSEPIDNSQCLEPNDCKVLLNYITNLQEELKSANESITWWTNRFKAVERDNERLKEVVENLTTLTVCGDKKQIKNTAQYKLDIYKQRNEKAIEYVKENQYIKIHEEGFTHEGEEYYILPNSDIVLDILQGEDNS